MSSQEFESIALKIEAEYRRKLKMGPREDKKGNKKRKRKLDEDTTEQKKKKIKKHRHSDNKENSKEEKEKKVISDFKLDDPKDLFKDIKDGRIKPGAIIKSKDIAKKEGVVKKETKPPSEGKPKAKPNPFGKINKQENTKLTSLIAKAKESRVGLVPNSEVGDSPKLSLGSIILFGDIGSGKHSVREPNSPEEEDKLSEKMTEKSEKWENSPWESNADKDLKDEISNPPSSQHNTEEEDEKEEIEEVSEMSPEICVEDEGTPPSNTTTTTEFKQSRATPNLSAWFKAFGGPKLSAAPRKRMINDDDQDDLEGNNSDEDDEESNKLVKLDKDTEEDSSLKDEIENEKDREIHVASPDSIPEEPPPSLKPPSEDGNNGRTSPQNLLSPEKPPETPWYDKLSNEKLEDEPIWKKNKV